MKFPRFTLLRRKLTKAAIQWQSGACDADAIRLALQLLLDREPRDQAEIEGLLAACPTIADLRELIVRSPEFRARNPDTYSPAMTGFEPPMQIEPVRSEEELQALLAHVQKVWERFGENEPYWSVLTGSEYSSANIHNTKEQFYQSGKGDVEVLFRTLERNGIDPSGYRTCLDFGCGVGRITRWLADRFNVVHGCDISQAHLDIARDYLASQEINNVQLRHIAMIADLDALPKVDVVFSVIVLQHNPPPVMEIILRSLLHTINRGGIGYFQIPTYKQGYSFATLNHLRLEATIQRATKFMEMHYLPQQQIFNIIQDEGCHIIEVLDDIRASYRFSELSNSFLVRRWNSCSK